MKRVLMLTVAALMLAPAAMAQIATPFKIDKDALVKEIQRSDKTLENEKRASRGQTWLDRGNALYNASAAVASQIYSGMSLADLTAVVGKEAQTSEKELPNGRTYKVVSIPAADIYLLDDVVQFWVEKITVYEGSTEKAYEAYKKAAELDSKLAPKVKEGLTRVADIYKMQANTLYNMGENMPAAEKYLKAFRVQADPLVNVVDSNSVFNAGYLYVTNKDYDKAIEIFEDAVAKDVWADGNIAYFLSWSYLQTKDYPKAKDILQRGIKLFPENKSITEGLINYYSLAQDDFSEIIDVLQKAVKEDPDNIVLWNGLGQAYLNKENRTESIDFFTRFVAKFPNDFGANYYLGDQWMEEGEALLKEADGDGGMSQAQKNETRAKAMDAFKKAFPPLEKAFELNRSEKAAIQRVTRVLFRLKDEPGMQPVFEKYNEIYEAME